MVPIIVVNCSKYICKIAAVEYYVIVMCNEFERSSKVMYCDP